MKPISRTAFYCTGVRAIDARSSRPACDDGYAERFLDAEAWQAFEPFRRLRGANITNRTRHRIIDDLLRERLARDPNRRIVILGAGFDSRAFRLRGGRWLEIDEPQVFAWKEPRLPAADAPNPVTRLPMDFNEEQLTGKLAEFADPGPVTVVIEGVLFYLGEARTREVLRQVRALFPRGEVVCDVMTHAFFRNYSRAIHRQLLALGAPLRPPERPLADIFAGERYQQTTQISITRRAAELGQMPWFMRTLLYVSRTFVDGYSIRVLEPA